MEPLVFIRLKRWYAFLVIVPGNFACHFHPRAISKPIAFIARSALHGAYPSAELSSESCDHITLMCEPLPYRLGLVLLIQTALLSHRFDDVIAVIFVPLLDTADSAYGLVLSFDKTSHVYD